MLGTTMDFDTAELSVFGLKPLGKFVIDGSITAGTLQIIHVDRHCLLETINHAVGDAAIVGVELKPNLLQIVAEFLIPEECRNQIGRAHV